MKNTDLENEKFEELELKIKLELTLVGSMTRKARPALWIVRNADVSWMT